MTNYLCLKLGEMLKRITIGPYDISPIWASICMSDRKDEWKIEGLTITVRIRQKNWVFS